MMRSLLAVAGVGLASAGTLDPRVLSKVTIDLSTYPDAMCNDGSPGVYYFDAAPAGSPQSNIWIVYLQDGGWCWSKEICDARVSAEVNSVTSTTWGDSSNWALGSLLNAGDDSKFGDANVIWARYCSSDAWIGDKAADVPFASTSKTANNIHFKGHKISKAILKNLKDLHGMSTTEPQTVVLAGSSAGSRGVLHNLNHMKADFVSYGWDKVTPYGIIDSGLYVVEPTVDWTKSDLDVQARAVVTYNGAAVDPICAGMMPGEYGTEGADPSSVDPTGQNWRCLMAQFAVKTLEVPYVLHQFQMDAWGTYVQLPIPYGWGTKELMKTRPSWNTEMQIYRDIVREVMLTPPSAAQIAKGGRRATHSSACYQHMNMRGSNFKNKYKITMPDGNKVSLYNVINSFVFGAPGPTDAIENCTGWECGEDCDYTRGGRTSTDVCGWWYWFSALREMSAGCQNSLVDYHVSGMFTWPLDEACPCIAELPAEVVEFNNCPHLFAYGYSPGIPAPSYPGLFPFRPTQQPNPDTGKMTTFADLGQQCKSWKPPGKCMSWCNAYTCGVDSCTDCTVCKHYSAGLHCASWCNSWTCGMSHCKGCTAC